MFCNNCGAQMPDGTNFCNNCGAPQTQAQAPAAQTPPVSPMPPMPPVAPVQPEQPKKSKTGLIVGIIALIVVVATFCVTAFVAPGFLLKDKEEGKEDETDSVSTSQVETTNNEGTTKPVTYNLDDAEAVAVKYAENMGSMDFEKLFAAEIIGKDVIYKMAEDLLVESSGCSTAEEMYAALEEATGESIKSTEDVMNFVYKNFGYNSGASSCEVEVIDVAAFNETEASKYINETKADMASYFDANVVDWDDVKSYAMVEMNLSLSGSESTAEILLGYINGSWKVINIYEDGEHIQLMSIYFVQGMVE